MCISPTFAIISNRPTTERLRQSKIESMFHFEIVIGNESIGVLSFMNHPPDLSIPRNDRARSSQVPWSVVEVPRHRLARLKTSVSSSYITIFPRTRIEGERETGRRTERQEADDGRRKCEANGFPVAVNGTSINILCFSLCFLRFFPRTPHQSNFSLHTFRCCRAATKFPQRVCSLEFVAFTWQTFYSRLGYIKIYSLNWR